MAGADSYADLQIGLHRREADRYQVEVVYAAPESEVDEGLPPGKIVTAQFDRVALDTVKDDPAEYGKVLSSQLFADETLRVRFAEFRRDAAKARATLRLRLHIGPSAPELHDLLWETLCDPAGGQPLFLGEQIAFSRYLSSSDGRPVTLRAQGELKAVVAVANPNDLSKRNLAPVDVAGEQQRAAAGLGGAMQITNLADPNTPGKVTLNAIIDALRAGCDIFYLACHGMLVDGEPWLFLENDDGSTARVAGNDLVQRLRSDLLEGPRLIVLASCQSAGSGDGPAINDTAALAGLGPRLASDAGVPAVIAMQGRIAMSTVERLIPAFFAALQEDGQIDRAMAVARGSVRDAPAGDFWMPVLFLRLRGGRIWYTPGVSDEGDAFDKWPAIVRSIKSGRCTPVIGPKVAEPLIGSLRDLAQRWSSERRFPLAPHMREDLAYVAQFLAVNQDPLYPRDTLLEQMETTLRERFGARLPAKAKLDKLFAAATPLYTEQAPTNPYAVLARLPFKVYLTAGFDTCLAEALRAAGKEPREEICRWKEDLETLESIIDDPDYEPSEENPLVFSIFGNITEPDSLVITEDNYFDFLLGIERNKKLVPPVVLEMLANTALLFMGFRVDEWSFRVLFRSIIGQEGRRNNLASVAGQIVPEEDRYSDVRGTRKYLESYFDEAAKVAIYWGSVAEFADELGKKWESGGR